MKKQFAKIISLFSVFVLLCCPMAHMFATALSESKDVIAGKVDKKVLSAFDDGAKTAKVYVWLNDIDQKQVDKAVEQKTGLRADNLAVIDENISNELATRIVSEAGNDKLTTETEKMLQAYLDRTAAQRTQERERTDLYTATRRAEAKAQYNEKSAAFLSKNSISSEKVIFNSNYAPMLILELTKQEINALAKREDVLCVELYENLTVVSNGTLDENMEATGINRIKSVSGLTGVGVKVGIVEAFCFDDNLADSDFSDRLTKIEGFIEHGDNAHSYKVASIATGDSGIASETNVYVTGISSVEPDENGEGNGANYFTCIENIITMGVNVINMSFSIRSETSPSYNSLCQWTDHIISNHGVAIVASADNYNRDTNPNYYVNAPGSAENVITVGFYTQKSVNNNNIPVLNEYSCYVNGTAVEKPDLIAYGEYNGRLGTSYAAPMVTGTIALILELRPSLTVLPHVLKSIVMASCHEKAAMPNETYEAETMEMGITDKQGAGIFNPYIAVSIASHGTFGSGIIKTSDLHKTIYILQPNTWNSNAAIESINISLSWLREITPDYSSHISEDFAVGNKHTFYLRLYFEDILIDSSLTSNTSAQMVYTTLEENSPNTYELWISRASMGSGAAKYAYAWSVSTVRFQYSHPFEGVGYLKNNASGDYLQANAENLQIFQNQTFNGDFSQMWIIRKNINAESYKLQSAVDSIGNISIANINSAIINATDAKDVNILQNTDGSMSFVYTDGISTYALGITNSSTETGAAAVWSAYSGTLSDSQKWYFEPCAYEKGDHDLDGIITSDDTRFIMRAAVNLETPTTLQSFLCDIDGNGIITSEDTRIAMRYSTNLDP